MIKSFARSEQPIETLSTQLKTGMVFQYEGREFVHISGFNDTSLTSVFVTAVPLQNYLAGELDEDVIFQLCKETKLSVIGMIARRHAEIVRLFRGKRVDVA